ncbi:MAG: FAD-dependent oxidoreductase [Candidatus Parcubacteria bacterium]|nr:FAD-dependent oxidoreductase [Candidatus Parcubacteria bacterium]
MKNNIYDVIIIGLGPAGMTAAIYCSRKGLNTLIIGNEAGGQVAKSALIENYLGFGFKSGQELSQVFSEHLAKFKNISALKNIVVKSIAKKAKLFEVKLDNKKILKAKSLIIASGRLPRHLNILGEKEFINRGVSYCEVCDGPIFKDKITAVIGGGNSGLEAAISLAKLCTKVYVLEFTPKLKADLAYINLVKKLKNIQIITGAQLTKIQGKKFVESLEYKDLTSQQIKKLKVDGIFIEAGWIPSIDFDKLTLKNKLNEIIVDKQCRTSIPGVFAAGDITDIGYWQIIIAAGEGAKAALSAYQYLTKLE